MEYVPKHTIEKPFFSMVLMVKSWLFVMACLIYLWFICDGSLLEFSVMVLLFLSAGLPHCFYIMHFSNFKGCCWLRSVFITTKNIYIILILLWLWCLPESDVRASFSSFFLFFSFLGAWPSIIIICIQPQTWGASGCGNGASRFFFWATVMVPPASWCPTQPATLHIGSGGTGPV